MVSLTWQQINAWRLSQHCLSPRLQKPDYMMAVKRTGGIQAQLTSAAEMAIGARVDGLTPRDVQAALWKDRTLIKTWAMRAALHLIPATDLPLYVAARNLTDNRNWPYYFKYFGIEQAVLDDYLATAPEVLGSTPLTREQFASTIARHIKSPELHQLLVTKGWGTPLKPLAWRGELCFGPNQGQNVTFINPRVWIGEWKPIQPDIAFQEVARRYFQAYGPSTLKDFTLWWGSNLTPARKMFKSLQDELEVVDVEGWQALALSSTVEAMQDSVLSGTVNLLPLFDAYLMGIGRGHEIEPLLSMAYQKQVFRPQGWISAVVLVDGYIKGTWEYKNQRSQSLVKVNLFDSVVDWVKKGIAAEAERLGKFLNSTIVLEFNES